MSEIKAAYLISGSDEAKIRSARARLRARAEQEGGLAALRTFDPHEGRGAPDAQALLSAIPAMSLTASRRYLLAEHVERWRKAELEAVAEGLRALPEDLTVVLIAFGDSPQQLVSAVKQARGELLRFDAPRARELPSMLVKEARAAGFRLEASAARLLVERAGTSPLRLHQEIERLALWAGPGGEVTLPDLEELLGDGSQAAVYSLCDALLERNEQRALELAERLLWQGESVTGLIYALASRLRNATLVRARLDTGESPAQIQGALKMHPYAAKELIRRVRETSSEELRDAMVALADLEVWCRGGADYGDELALTLAVRRAVGAAA